MLFSSLEFLCLFFPVFFLCYFLVAKLFPRHIQVRNTVLLVFSLLFYAWGELSYLWLLTLSIVCNYVFALCIGHAQKNKSSVGAKLWLIADLVFNLGLLGVYKYTGLFMNTLNGVLGTDFSVPDIALPIGISFFTFQIMSYVIDVYRRNVPPQRNILTVAVYLCAFPQLIAGPIVRYADVEQQLAVRSETTDGVYSGLQRFIGGLAKKVIIANTCAAVCDKLFTNPFADLGAVGAWLGILAYTLQIYFDFSGYSDMAIGMGRMMGFDYKENFLYPYSATSITDFWRKWHISLSSFFREYVYIPLGGNRVSKARHILNLLIVWALTGLWHGASWNFVLWGAYYGVLLILEKYLYGKYVQKIPLINHAYTLVAVVFGWVFFRFESLSDVWQMFRTLFGVFGLTGTALKNVLGQSGVDMLFVVAFVVGWITAFPWFVKLRQRLLTKKPFAAITCILSLLLLAVCLLLMETGAYNPFIYFRF